MKEVDEGDLLEKDIEQTKDSRWFWKRFYKTVKFLQPFVTLTSLGVAIFAIFLTLHAREQTKKSNQENLKYLKSLDSLFADANMQLKLLPSSLTEFKSSVEGMSEIVSDERESFKGVFADLVKWLSTLKSTFLSYETSLGKVVEATDKQLILLSQKQELLEMELLRKPELTPSVIEVIPDSSSRVQVVLQIMNTGNEIADYCKIVLKVSEKLEFQSEGFRKYPGSSNPDAWSYTISDWIPYDTTRGTAVLSSPSSMRFSIRKPSNETKSVSVEYLLYHNRGSKRGIMKIILQ